MLTIKILLTITRVPQREIATRVRKEVFVVVATIGNRVCGASLTAKDSVIIQRVAMALSSITGSSGHRANSGFQSLDPRNFSGNTEYAPLITACRSDLIINHGRNDDTRNIEIIEDGKFPALRSSHDHQTLSHLSCFLS